VALVGRGSATSRTPLAVIVPDPSADDPFADLPVSMSAELKTWLFSSELDAIFRLPDGTLVALGPPERISPGFAFFPLTRPWRRGEPATTNYKMALDGTITKRRRLSATHIESTETRFGPADLVPTGALADRCDDCGSVSFTTLRDRDHHEACGRP
jgi:hypothetical protein